MEELLFESKGTPQKKKKMNHQAGWGMTVCGIFLFLFALIMDEGNGDIEGVMLFGILGGLGLIFGIYVLIKNALDTKDIQQLAIYTNHVEVYDKKICQQVVLEWREIYKVGKISSFNTDMLFLETEKGNYVVVINELNKAHHIIEQKLQNLQSV